MMSHSTCVQAIIPVHLYGRCVDMDVVLSVAKAHSLAVVEDAAQAHGAMYKGKRAGSMGQAGCFSFYPGKNLGAFGDGGAIVTNGELANRHCHLRSNCHTPHKIRHVYSKGGLECHTITKSPAAAVIAVGSFQA
jgi:dTDP-4-amino-4,6-dideoxygalactose transaminase